MTWNFTTGYSVSERAGEAWLVDNDTSEPEPADLGSKGEAGPGGVMKTRTKYRTDPY